MIDDERIKLALRATFDIEGLGCLVEQELNNSDDLKTKKLRHLAKSILMLNSIVMSALGDEMESTGSLGERFN